MSLKDRWALMKASDADIVARLTDLAYRLNAWTFEDGKRSLARLNREAKTIGRLLDRRGGKMLMLEIHRAAGSQRVIESAWDGVGSWRG
jgi:hypothetical protein